VLDLRNFVSETLLQISQGIADAKPNVKRIGGEVTPKDTPNVRLPTEIDFDVAVSAVQTGSDSVRVGVVEAGGTTSESAVISRLRFKVPMWLP
jgi:hypothetical protein